MVVTYFIDLLVKSINASQYYECFCYIGDTIPFVIDHNDEDQPVDVEDATNSCNSLLILNLIFIFDFHI